MKCATLLAATVTLLAAARAGAQAPATSAASQQRAQLRYEQGWHDLATESWGDAARDFQEAIDLDTTFKLAYYGLGRAEMGLKLFDRAAAAYEKCRDLYSTQFGARMSGRIDVKQLIADDSLQLDMAIQQLSKGPATAQKQTQIAQLQNQKQRIQLKGHGLDDLSLTSGVPAFVSLALGSAYFRGTRFQDAEAAYKAALAVEPKTGEAYNNLAVVYLMTERIDEAEKAVKAAEKAGYQVNENLKSDIKKKKSGGPPAGD